MLNRLVRMVYRCSTAVALCLLAGMRPGVASADLSSMIRFDIAPQQMPSALLEYSEQSGVQVAGSGEIIEGKNSAGVVGAFPARGALEKLLAGTNLVYDVVDSNTVAIRERTASRPNQAATSPAATQAEGRSANSPDSAAGRRGLWDRIRIAQAGPGLGANPQEGDGALANAAAADAPAVEEVTVTGSRILRQDYIATSSISTVSQEAVVGNANITLESYLNTLPQAVAGGTSTSNNPTNGGRANMDLRGLGANRNLVLLDGRRPMVSANDLTVDLNTIPAALIDRVEVITGGAGAVYGADAIAGVVNIKLKDKFTGFDLRTSYQNSTEYWDAEETSVSAVYGLAFADELGNAVFAYDHSEREVLLKNQRPFSVNASSTTGTPPDGVLRWNSAGAAGLGSNPVTQASVNSVFANYGVAAGAAQAASGKIGFNTDGTLFAVGTFNSPLDMQNFLGDPNDPNARFAPDFYSYNFDPPNLLQLPLNRDSFMTKLNYQWDSGIEAFGRAGWTRYTAATGLAASPVPGVSFASVDQANPKSEVGSALITAGANSCFTNAAHTTTGRCTFSGGIPVPVTNPFIPASVASLLASRTGDDTRLVGAGATEPFLVSFRPVEAGLRQEDFKNTVIDSVAGVRGPIGDTAWRYEASLQAGRTEIIDDQTGNIDTQKVTDLLAMPQGGAEVCAGGLNIFGARQISQECLDYVMVSTRTQTDLRQRIVQGFVAGDLLSVPAGPVSVVVGAEHRSFDYTFDPGSGAGPISGFLASNAGAGENEFLDFFGESLIPVTSTIQASLGYRSSRSQFKNNLTGVESAATTKNSYKLTGTWQAADPVLLRASYQRSVRAPNFAELFAGGTLGPIVFNPCSSSSAARTGANGAAVLALCQAINGGPLPSGFQEIPGTQAQINTIGNASLQPETADTYTAGVAIRSPWENPLLSGLSFSVDYYDIRVRDAILTPDPNVAIADCFNYLGSNPTYDVNRSYCRGIGMAGGSIAGALITNVNSTGGRFQNINGGSIDTSGVDLQADWKYILDGAGTLSLNSIVSYLIDYELQNTPGAPAIDYAGTVNYYLGGISLGQTLPEWRATLNPSWNVGQWTLTSRARWIGAMDNRLSRQFRGESATGTPSVWYFDAAVGYAPTDRLDLRIGVNNIADKQPPIYDPNIQSGTDPGTFDIIGRRVFAQVHLQF